MSPPLPESSASTTPSEQAIRDALVAHFSLDELYTLAHDLSIDKDSIAGDTKETYARELVTYRRNRSQLPQLATAIRTARPQILFAPSAVSGRSPEDYHRDRIDEWQRAYLVHERERFVYLALQQSADVSDSLSAMADGGGQSQQKFNDLRALNRFIAVLSVPLW
ncbi:MAG: hypothetical protein HC853_08680 [Anaerolineae bacterium]|nr:hypothetical protein [Anaerolineae bacterium]